MLAAQNADGGTNNTTDSGIFLYIEEDVEVHAAFPKPKPRPNQQDERGQNNPRDQTHRMNRRLQERVSSYGLDMVQTRF